MEQWYIDGEVLDSDQAIRNYFRNISFPSILNDVIKLSLGLIKVVDVKPTIIATQRVIDGDVVLVGGVPIKAYTVVTKTPEEIAVEQSAAMVQVVQHFTDVTTAYIEAKVAEYNAFNKLAFKDIDAFAKYAVTPTSVHNAIAIQFIGYADRLWAAVRTYQSTATTIPTDVEFKAILDGVVF